MTINLILGSDGFLGKPFCKYLENLGEKVIYFDIKRNKNQDGRIIKLDLEKIDRVYFLAWDVGGSKYLYKKDVQVFQLEWNLKIMMNLMPQLYTAKKPFLFISSQLAEENDTVYGVTKRLGEVWTRLSERGLFVRQWNVYGTIEDYSERSHVISDFIKQALMTGEIKMLTTGEEKRQFVHINDMCEAWHMVLSQNLKGIHDITSFEWVKILDVANLIGKITGAKVMPGKKIGANPMTPIKGKIPNWFPKINLEDGLNMMIKKIKDENG